MLIAIPFAINPEDRELGKKCPVARNAGKGFHLHARFGNLKEALLCREMFYNRLKTLLTKNRQN